MRARSSQSSLTLAALALAGCSGGAATVARATPRTLSTATQARGDDPDESQPVAVRHVPRVASIEDDATVIEASSQETLVALGPARAILRGHDVMFADERPVAPVVRAVRNARGWSFATEDGQLWASDHFLGDLRFVGEITGPIEAPPSAGTLVAIDESRSVTLCDGLTTSRWPAEATQSAAFADERFGAAVLADGRVKVTFDGGRTERALDLGAGAARSVELVGDTLVLQTSDGLRAIGRDATLAPAQRVAAPLALSFEQQLDLARALARRWPRALTHDSADALSAHSWLAVGRSLLRFDARTGELTATLRDVLPSSRCSARPWGEGALVSCAGGELEVVIRGEGGLRVSPFSGRSSSGFVLSDDGAHAVATESCESLFGLQSNPEARLCALGAGGRFANLWRQRSYGFVSALRGATAVVVEQREGRGALVSVELDQRSSTPLGFAPDAPSTRELRASGIAADATVWATYASDASDAPELSLALWSGRGPARVRSLPPATRSVALIDARHIFAAGTSAASLSVSSDGGARWERATLALRGDPDRVVAVEPQVLFGRATCGVDGCLHGSMWFGRGGGPARDVVVAPPVDAGQAPRRSQRGFPLWIVQGTRVDCAERGPGVALSSERQGASWGRYDIDVRVRSRRAVSLDLSWRTDAERSAVIHRASAVVEASQSAAFVESALDRNWRVPLATERYALVERCANGVQRRACDRFIATSAGLRPLDALDAYGETLVYLSRDGETHAVLLAPSSSPYRALALLDREGRVTATHAVLHTNYRWDAPTIAARGSSLGVLVHSARRAPPERAFVALFDGDRPIAPRVEPLPATTPGALALCRARPQRGALSVASADPDTLLQLVNGRDLANAGSISMVVELSPDQPICVRSSSAELGPFVATRSSTSDPRGNVTAFSARAADGGALLGGMVIDGRLRPLRCVLR